MAYVYVHSICDLQSVIEQILQHSSNQCKQASNFLVDVTRQTVGADNNPQVDM